MVNYTLKQLRYVEAAGRLGSIAGAAAELSISQSSITAAIDALEQGFGYDLFLRTPAKGIRPTPPGQEALQLIRRFIHQSRHFEAEVRSVGSTLAGNVRLACYATAAPAFLPPILRSLTERFPEVSITMLEGSLPEMLEFLDEGEADLAFTYGEERDQRHLFYSLFRAPPYALVPLDDPLADRADVTLAELVERPMVLLDLPGARKYFMELFDAEGLVPQIAHTSRSSEIVRALVSSGFGFSLLNIRPLGYSQDESPYRVLPLRGDHRHPDFGIVTMAETEQPTIVQAFIENCLDLRQEGAFASLIVE